ncbi:MAG: Mth938-like domain-containing protein [Planctomycetota bacterium]
MNPTVDETEFGHITVNGNVYDHDIVIRLSGQVKKRKKKLSKQQHGTSHTVSLAEAEHMYDEGAERIVLGTGQHGVLELSNAAREFFQNHGCTVMAAPTPDAVKIWNHAEGKTIAMFHVTC